MSRAERTREMMAHVAAKEQSGQSRKAYCAKHNLNLHVLNYWCAKGKRHANAHGFVPVEVSTGASLELHYPNGVRLLLPMGTALEQVAACIRLY